MFQIRQGFIALGIEGISCPFQHCLHFFLTPFLLDSNQYSTLTPPIEYPKKIQEVFRRRSRSSWAGIKGEAGFC